MRASFTQLLRTLTSGWLFSAVHISCPTHSEHQTNSRTNEKTRTQKTNNNNNIGVFLLPKSTRALFLSFSCFYRLPYHFSCIRVFWDTHISSAHISCASATYNPTSPPPPKSIQMFLLLDAQRDHRRSEIPFVNERGRRLARKNERLHVCYVWVRFTGRTNPNNFAHTVGGSAFAKPIQLHALHKTIWLRAVNECEYKHPDLNVR